MNFNLFSYIIITGQKESIIELICISLYDHKSQLSKRYK